MIPSLFTFTLLAAAVLLLVGFPFLLAPARIEKAVRAFPRDMVTGWVTMLIGGGWFLLKIYNLGEADFGNYKQWLLLLFVATLLGTLFYVRDFLAVRGVSIIVLLSANTGLKSAYALYEIPERLLLVTILYVLIVVAMMYGVMPYKMRDSVNWLYRSSIRARLLGIILVLAGSSLVLAATQY